MRQSPETSMCSPMAIDWPSRILNAARQQLRARSAPVGKGWECGFLGAVEATAAAVETNTNLGIILLCAPLAAAAETKPSDLRYSLAQTLSSLDRDDADGAFQAIVRESQAGLGRTDRRDVLAPATASPRGLAEAADGDRVAQQYGTDFADVFERGEPLLVATLARSADRRLATLVTYLDFLAAFPDSHIVRSTVRLSPA